MNTRRVVALVVIMASTGVLAHARRATPPAADVSRLPYTVGAWRGADAPPLSPETLSVLAADAYINRTYADNAGTPVGLYVALYREQRPTASIHSPLHCLPGTGWEALEVGTVPVIAGAAPATAVRRMIVRKGRERALVLYSYDVHGRMLANELASKLWLLHDSLRYGRSNASLLRVVVPIGESAAAAERRGLEFVRSVLPYVSQLWS